LSSAGSIEIVQKLRTIIADRLCAAGFVLGLRLQQIAQTLLPCQSQIIDYGGFGKRISASGTD
jgi:hypothetical protein